MKDLKLKLVSKVSKNGKDYTSLVLIYQLPNGQEKEYVIRDYTLVEVLEAAGYESIKVESEESIKIKELEAKLNAVLEAQSKEVKKS